MTKQIKISDRRRALFTQRQIAWVDEARTVAERNRRLLELKSYTSGEKLIDGQKWSCPAGEATAH